MIVVRRFGLLILGVVLLVVGLVLVATQRLSVGWWAYAPLADSTMVVWDSSFGFIAGIVLAAIGLVLVSVWLGIQFGRRRP